MSDTYELFQRGRTHLRSGRPAQATVSLEKAKRREPASRSIREALGIAYFRLGRWQEAEAEFQALVDLSPDDEFAHRALGRALAKQGRSDEAAPHFKLARSLRPRGGLGGARRRLPQAFQSPATRRTSSAVVTPSRQSRIAVLAERSHAAGDGRTLDLGRRGVLRDKHADLLGQRQHLEERDPSPKARAPARVAADSAGELALLRSPRRPRASSSAAAGL